MRPPFAAVVSLALLAFGARAEIIEADLVVFGGTAGGVSAACTAAMAGKTVALAEPGQHIGGLTSGGLGWTDIGNKAAIGGFAREFYRRLGTHYGKAEAWTFEPGVAEKELRKILEENRVPVKLGQRLARVKKDGARITAITMEDGTEYHGKIFIDTTYEGDLMARAGVSYLVGREANSRFGETLNGIRAQTPQHQFLAPVDPYVTPGDPSSGLLPFVSADPLGEAGAGDASVQAYNFRLCLTRKASNRLPIEPPADYEAGRYELLGRYFAALAAANKNVTLRNFLKIDMVTPEKTDINNQGGFSTDYIGANNNYPDADYATREKIWKDHRDYIKGFLTFLKTDSRVPESVRTEMAEWGLCRDEFQDTGGWPHAMYVREARRLDGAYVMAERNCRGLEVADDSIGLGAYNMDSHNCRRIVRDGKAHNEGDVQVGVKPYPIAYRSITPKINECENLLVPICLSATHIAYGSIRMEPVFMILGQSSAIAGVMALDAGVPVQKVNYAGLRDRLLQAGQVLSWNAKAGGQSEDHQPVANRAVLPGILLDDTDAERTGDWQQGSLTSEASIGPGYLHDGNSHKGESRLTWKLRPPRAGKYAVIFRYVPNANRTRAARLVLKEDRKDQTFSVDQTDASGVKELGVLFLGPESGASLQLTNAATDGHVVADGVQLLPKE